MFSITITTKLELLLYYMYSVWAKRRHKIIYFTLIEKVFISNLYSFSRSDNTIPITLCNIKCFFRQTALEVQDSVFQTKTWQYISHQMIKLNAYWSHKICVWNSVTSMITKKYWMSFSSGKSCKFNLIENPTHIFRLKQLCHCKERLCSFCCTKVLSLK